MAAAELARVALAEIAEAAADIVVVEILVVTEAVLVEVIEVETADHAGRSVNTVHQVNKALHKADIPLKSRTNNTKRLQRTLITTSCY